MSNTRALIARWHDDAGGTYRSWFLWEQRLKNFRSIRSGIREVVAEIAADTFGYSGIVRLLDLSFGAPATIARELFIVAPDDREPEVRAQVQRPAFRGVGDLRVRYLPYGELERHRESMARFGEGLKGIQSVSRVLC